MSLATASCWVPGPGPVAHRLPAHAAATESALEPEVFRLPVERLRDGYYADAYFVYTKQLLEHTGHHPRVLMQVFQKQQSLLGGIDEAIAILKLGAGRLGTAGEWTPGCGRAGGARTARG